MKILVTGASGFLGRSFVQSLEGVEMITLGRTNADIISDIGTEIPTLPAVDMVVHIAGKAHVVPKTKKDVQDFFDINVLGTRRILEALEKLETLPKAFVFISSVSVYGLENAQNVTEMAPLLAKDPYGKSKIEAEDLLTKWGKNNNVICTILRLPLIAAPNPPGNLGSMIKGILRGYYFNIDGGKAKKSIVLGEDVAKIIPLASKIGGIFNLTDGYHPSFNELALLISNQLGRSSVLNMPLWMAKIIAKIGDIFGGKAPLDSNKLKKVTSTLTFDDSKAKRLLNWNPNPVLKGFIIR